MPFPASITAFQWPMPIVFAFEHHAHLHNFPLATKQNDIAFEWMSFTGFYWTWQGFIGCLTVLLVFHLGLLGFTRFYWV